MTDEQKRYDNRFWFYYKDHGNLRRRYGIYAPAIDRFLHVSGYDMWMSLETAEILSSKLQTMVYALPYGYINSQGKEIINNENCWEWGIYNKLDLKIGTSNVLIARQTPSLGMLYPDDKLERHVNLPDEFQNNPTIFKKIKEYADYVYPRVIAINLAATLNPYYSKRFIDNYLDEGWPEKTSNKPDPSLSNRGIDFDIKNILYRSNSKEEAEEEITKYWEGNYYDIGYMMNAYYKTLGDEIPKRILDISKEVYHVNHSVWTM